MGHAGNGLTAAFIRKKRNTKGTKPSRRRQPIVIKYPQTGFNDRIMADGVVPLK
ncbi:MAG: hypothetical protein ACI9ND_001795 [Yoonia sp.]